MIELSHLSARYHKRSRYVLQDVSFAIEDAQVGVLLGPNGAGKSTLLKCILGLMPYEGEIFIDGNPCSKMSKTERSRMIAYVPQNLSFSASTVFDAVMLGRLPHFGFVPDEEDHFIVIKTLDEMGLGEMALRNVTELSGGERQKVAIARALAQEAKILVLDEPTSNLDIAAETGIAKMVKNLAKQRGFTSILSMHDLNLALSIGDRFAFLKDGSLCGWGGNELMNEGMIADVFGIKASRVQIDSHDFIVYGGKDE
ncbi:MAG: ABC transporter ATP-binding protein [Bacilli bacterium]|nr:ABC transporter ATP-binding protein [Bacilli bacterium]